ncbi:MAG: hypothetical protein M3271_10270 [Actinomycetota bacterium]|nr:hypothetical protein [Actinomycetota bacterium]
MLGAPLLVETDDARMGDFVALFWEPFLTKERDAHGGRFLVETGDGRWRLRWGPEAEMRAGAIDPWVFGVVLRNNLTIAAVAAARSTMIPLHASVAERDGMVLVLSGPPEAGKTTLLLELLGRGWNYVSDDLAPIRRADGDAVAFPKSLQVRDVARWQEWAHAWRVPSWLPPPATTSLIPGGAFTRSTVEAYRPGLLIFSRYVSGQSPSLQRLSAAEAVGLAVDNLQDLAPAKPSDLAVVTTWIAGVPSFRMIYGDTHDGLALLDRALHGQQKLE